MKDIDETINYFTEDIKQNEFMSKKHKRVFKILNYIEHLHILAFPVTWCVAISALASLFVFSISSSAVGNLI